MIKFIKAISISLKSIADSLVVIETILLKANSLTYKDLSTDANDQPLVTKEELVAYLTKHDKERHAND